MIPLLGLVMGKMRTSIVNRAPAFRPPDYNPTDLPAGDPNWKRLDALTEEAWRRGISRAELGAMDSGFCPDQIEWRIRAIQGWLDRHPA